MFGILRVREVRRPVEAGRVCCPLRSRDADVDLCLGCNFAGEVELATKNPFVACQPPRAPLLLP